MTDHYVTAVELRDLIAARLAKRWAVRAVRNPEWDHRLDFEAWKRMEPYDVPEMVEVPMAEQVKQGPMEHGNAPDGLPTMWVPSILSLADEAARAVFAVMGVEREANRALDAPSDGGP